MIRTEFGYPRTTCACEACVTNCRFMPGYLIPSDLTRLVPSVKPVEWAEENLLASPGALVMKNGETFRIKTLVPATKPDGSCIHLSTEGRCDIHANAPFGCAFFDCKPERAQGAQGAQGGLSRLGLIEVMKAWQEPYSSYTVIWTHLWYVADKRQHPPEELRERMREALEPNDQKRKFERLLRNGKR